MRLLNGMYLVNAVFQKILRINSSISFTVNFTLVVFSDKNIRFSGENMEIFGRCKWRLLSCPKWHDTRQYTILSAGVKLI